MELYKLARPCYGSVETGPQLHDMSSTACVTGCLNKPLVRLTSPVMELVIVVSTITSFFSHLMIEKRVLAHATSVALATLITFVLIGDPALSFDGTLVRNVFITVVLALVVSMVVGRVFTLHKRCS